MGKRSGRVRAWMMDNAYLVTIGCVLAMVVGCAMYTQSLKEEQTAGIQTAANAPEIQDTPVPSASPAVTPLPTIAPLTLRPAALVQSAAVWPIDGETLRAYDAQSGVYWERLGTWQTHTALDIAGTAGESVKATMDGIVTKVSRDALWGWQITISHADDRQTRYCGLESSTVQEGMRVAHGQILGILMESIPCEAELPTHLHLEMLSDGRHQDPEATLPEK